MSDFVAAEAGIRQLHERYTDAVWRQDFDAFAECFTEDGEWRISGMVLQGRAQIRETIAAILSRFNRVLISFRTPILQVGEGVASGRTYIDERCAWKNGDTNISMGLYYEHFVEQDGRWLFDWRLFQMLYRGDPDLTGTFYDFPDYGPPPGMPPRDALPADTATARWGLKV
ncbi:YybH family protein [Novosphingobium sp. JCM 18896]|uniref:YybH family protein n=1 Tax=Novosphingobium sp. JCM 18896 TaxID=2989731 RepID=UPI002221969E|nr:nuclear transport factor 2 family protein [Novosphingobium sp. JCM 18896]MCW1429846.1 nuclear transport factor 2 family protein [Novosphingobium sp. JCM 18896]